VNHYAAVYAVACKLYNTGAVKMAEDLFPGRHPDYLDEWTERFMSGFARAVSHMDEETFRRFVDLALAEHGENALLYHPDEETT